MKCCPTCPNTPVKFNSMSLPNPFVCQINFRDQFINATNAHVTHDWYTFYNADYGNSWVMHGAGSSFIQVDTNFSKNPDKTYTLNLDHLSSLVDGQPLAKITILVNGEVVKTGHNPNDGNYIHEEFDITDYLKDGENQIRIQLDGDAWSNYWIQSLAIQAK